MDFTRAAAGEKGFYVGELQGGFGTRGVVVGEEITPEEIELYSWGLVAQVAAELARRGLNPPVFVSPNVPGFPADNNELEP